MQHELKTWPEGFQAIAQGRKTADVRFNDRGFKVGDILLLREYYPGTGKYSGENVEAEVTHIMDTEGFGLKPGYVMLSLRPIPSQIAPLDVEKLPK
ncbi:MAG: DUF3850 domain-containing protein [Candidatus Glassbacteria bacterium]|nr:DUF3850 domain-containing protein [Candidatus Glassbacteria bacterium]